MERQQVFVYFFFFGGVRACGNKDQEVGMRYGGEMVTSWHEAYGLP